MDRHLQEVVLILRQYGWIMPSFRVGRAGMGIKVLGILALGERRQARGKQEKPPLADQPFVFYAFSAVMLCFIWHAELSPNRR
jgi:hypothetical protein